MNGSPNSTERMNALTDNSTLRRRLFVATVCAEAIVIPVCAWTGLRLSGGDLSVAGPIFAVSALEACRIPLSSYATRLKPFAKLTAIAALAGLGLLTGEVMAAGFSAVIAGRLSVVTEASAERDASRDRLAAERAALDRLTADAAAARASLSDLSAHPPALADVKSQTCLGRRGRSYDCTPASALRANANAQAAYDERLKQAQETLTEAEDRLKASPGLKTAEDALQASEARLRGAVRANPMAQLFAGLTDAQLDRVRSIVSVSLGLAVAFTTSLLAFLAHVEPRVPGRESKVARAFRAMLAARRKTIRQLRAEIRTEYRDRFIHVPVDPVSGRVLDPDARP